MKTTTLCYLVKGGEVLLAMKKQGPRGFGVGKWNGVGGKIEKGENVEQGAIREIKEEIGVDVDTKNLVPAGSLTLIYEGSPDWDQVVHLFVIHIWKGEPRESEEMRPQWFRKDKLPFENMWADDPYWLPQVLDGKNISGNFIFDATGKYIISQNISLK